MTVYENTSTFGGDTHTATQTVTKASTKSSYPSYFYTPQENLLDAKRGTRYDRGQPKAFHLTQPDNNLAKFVFLN